MSQYQCGGPSSQNPYASSPRWAVTPPTSIMRRMPIPVRIAPFLHRGCPQWMYAGLARFSPGCPPDRGRLHTCYSPVRRSPARKCKHSLPLPLDLHVLSLPLAFILSQDQTLRCYLYLFRSFFFYFVSVQAASFIQVQDLTGNLYLQGRASARPLLVSLVCCSRRNLSSAVSCGIISLSSSLPVSPSFHPRSVCDSGCKITIKIFRTQAI